MCIADELLSAAERLKRGSIGDAKTVRAAAKAIRLGRATQQQIAHAKRLASGVLKSRKGK